MFATYHHERSVGGGGGSSGFIVYDVSMWQISGAKFRGVEE
jgi:hypothetical protein